MRVRFRVRFFEALVGFLLIGNVGLAAAPPQQSSSPVEREIRRALVMLPYYSVFDNLEFQVEGNLVRLFGQVVRPVLKSTAEKAVARVPGVQRVDNQIEVLPVSMFDDEIRLRVYRSIYHNPDFSRYVHRALPPVHIIVKGGHVTLVGAVGSEQDKTLAGLWANAVANVFSVTNELVVG